MKELNVEFIKMARDNMDFLKRYPMVVDPQNFEWVTGDKETHNPMTGSTVKHRTGVGKTLMTSGTDMQTAKYISHKTAPVYADFNYLEKTGVNNKQRVGPSLHLNNYGGHCVKLFYLPWKEDRHMSMVIDEQADFFMTASMHGCRFEVKDFGNGMLNVSHTNVQPGPGIDAQAKVLKLIRDDSCGAPTALSFGKDKYFPDASRCITATRRGLMPMGILPEHVLSAHVDTYLANVIGVRQGNKWKFYYQLTCYVEAEIHGETTKRRYLGMFGRKKVDVSHKVKIDVVLKVAKIWPEEATIYVL